MREQGAIVLQVAYVQLLYGVLVMIVHKNKDGSVERMITVSEANQQIKAALERGEQIPGAELALGDEGLMVRTK